MRVLVLQHLACEHPGAFAEVMDRRGVERTTVELDEGERLPDWREFDAIVAMGGPMSVTDDAQLPWLTAEKQLVREAVQAGTPFLGVCLGVQLLAASLGARTYPAPEPEVGLLPVELTDAGRADPVLGGLEWPIVTVQWHGDTFELPDGAELLARSAALPHQAFRAGERAYGVQFHLEVTAEMAREWGEIPAYRASLASTLGPERGSAFLEEAARREHELRDQAHRLIEAWLDVAGR